MQISFSISSLFKHNLLVAFAVATLCGIQTHALPAQMKQVEYSPVKMKARFHVETGTNSGFLIVQMDVPPGNFIYSLTQQAPLKPSKLLVKSTKQLVAEKKFKPDKKPKVTQKDPLFNARLEKHTGTVQFYVPLKIADQVDPKLLHPEVVYSGQVCSDQGYCVPIRELKVKAEFAGYFEREAKNTIPPLKLPK